MPRRPRACEGPTATAPRPAPPSPQPVPHVWWEGAVAPDEDGRRRDRDSDTEGRQALVLVPVTAGACHPPFPLLPSDLGSQFGCGPARSATSPGGILSAPPPSRGSSAKTEPLIGCSSPASFVCMESPSELGRLLQVRWSLKAAAGVSPWSGRGCECGSGRQPNGSRPISRTAGPRGTEAAPTPRKPSPPCSAPSGLLPALEARVPRLAGVRAS